MKFKTLFPILVISSLSLIACNSTSSAELLDGFKNDIAKVYDKLVADPTFKDVSAVYTYNDINSKGTIKSETFNRLYTYFDADTLVMNLHYETMKSGNVISKDRVQFFDDGYLYDVDIDNKEYIKKEVDLDIFKKQFGCKSEILNLLQNAKNNIDTVYPNSINDDIAMEYAERIGTDEVDKLKIEDRDFNGKRTDSGDLKYISRLNMTLETEKDIKEFKTQGFIETRFEYQLDKEFALTTVSNIYGEFKGQDNKERLMLEKEIQQKYSYKSISLTKPDISKFENIK